MEPSREDGEVASREAETVDSQQKGDGVGSKMEQGEDDDKDPDFVFYSRKEEGLTLISSVLFNNKNMPVYVKTEIVPRVLRYFDCEEYDHEIQQREAGEELIKLYVPNLYGKYATHADGEKKATLVGVKPDLMEVTYEPRKQLCNLLPTTLEERERAAAEILAKEEPSYLTEIDKRMLHMKTALKKILDPCYEIRNEKAKMRRAQQIFWSQAWKSMPAATDLTISLAEPRESDHIFITTSDIVCGHVHNPKFFHLVLPQIIGTMDREWQQNGKFGFEDGFFNFLAVFMEYSVCRLNIAITHARRDLCYNE